MTLGVEAAGTFVFVAAFLTGFSLTVAAFLGDAFLAAAFLEGVAADAVALVAVLVVLLELRFVAKTLRFMSR